MFTRRLLVSCISAAVLTSGAAQAVDAKAAARATAQLSQQQSQPAQAQIEKFGQAQLDQMLAPIALYPDTVLTHVLIASTYPLELVKAARWLTTQQSMTSEQLLNAAENQDWDPSVRALVAFPNIITTLNNDLDWTQNVGDAFLAQPDDVMDTIQRLREKAYAAGSLNNQQYYTVERKERVIVIEPRSPEVVYVPVYDARYVYGDWWWHDYPPVYWRSHSGYSSGSYFSWGMGVRVAPGFYFSTVYWPRREVIVVPHYHRSHYYRAHDMYRHEERRYWRHEPEHRRGVEYRRGYDPVADVRERESRDYRGHGNDGRRNENRQHGRPNDVIETRMEDTGRLSPREAVVEKFRRGRGEEPQTDRNNGQPRGQRDTQVIERQDNAEAVQVGQQIQERRQSALERIRQRQESERQGGTSEITSKPELRPQEQVRDRFKTPVNDRYNQPRPVEQLDREPIKLQPIEQEPARRDPVIRDTLRNEPITRERVRQEPVFQEPVRREPVFQEPVRSEPVFREPVRNEPVFQEPVRSEPVFREPVRNEPVFQEPVRNEPVFREPVRSEPVFREPARIERPQMESGGGDRIHERRRDD